MASGKSEELQLLVLFLTIAGSGLLIPGGLLFGPIEFVLGYLVFSAFVLSGVLLYYNAGRLFRRAGARPRVEAADPFAYFWRS